jgi:radical SAM protein with 4Fe4S-binding SPASM domain
MQNKLSYRYFIKLFYDFNGFAQVRKISKVLFAKRPLKPKYNYIVTYVQALIKNVHVFGYPRKLTIDPVNLCNLQCSLCPTGTRSPGRARSHMTFSTFKKIIDELGHYLWTIDLYNWGEPLLNKDIFKMVEYAKSYKIDVNISTNLNYFNDDICAKLVNSGLDCLIISLDGASQTSVEKYQKGSNFALVINNIKQLIETKERLKSITPLIKWRFIANKFNENEIRLAKELANDIKINELEISYIRCNMGIELLLNNEAQYDNIKTWLPDNEELSMYDYFTRQKKQIKKSCELLLSESVINPDGSVSPCCAVWQDKYDFGNINNEYFATIWNNNKYKQARRIIRGANISDKEHICYICKSNMAMI